MTFAIAMLVAFARVLSIALIAYLVVSQTLHHRCGFARTPHPWIVIVFGTVLGLASFLPVAVP